MITVEISYLSYNHQISLFRLHTSFRHPPFPYFSSLEFPPDHLSSPHFSLLSVPPMIRSPDYFDYFASFYTSLSLFSHSISFRINFTLHPSPSTLLLSVHLLISAEMISLFIRKDVTSQRGGWKQQEDEKGCYNNNKKDIKNRRMEWGSKSKGWSEKREEIWQEEREMDKV